MAKTPSFKSRLAVVFIVYPDHFKDEGIPGIRVYITIPRNDRLPYRNVLFDSSIPLFSVITKTLSVLLYLWLPLLQPYIYTV